MKVMGLESSKPKIEMKARRFEIQGRRERLWGGCRFKNCKDVRWPGEIFRRPHVRDKRVAPFWSREMRERRAFVRKGWEGLVENSWVFFPSISHWVFSKPMGRGRFLNQKLGIWWPKSNGVFALPNTKKQDPWVFFDKNTWECCYQTCPKSSKAPPPN